MRWKKLGLIFCPENNYEWATTHAAIPFAEIVSDCKLRVYFSPRNSKGYAVVGIVDFNLNHPLKSLTLMPQPILEPGELGCFDENGAMISWIVRDGSKRYLYYVGWNIACSVPFRNAIGLVIDDGGGFKKIFNGPVLDRGSVDPCFVSNPCVLKDGEVWKMWYLSCDRWVLDKGMPKHFYRIKYAESEDGIHWRRDGVVCIDFKSPDEYAISRPCVLKDHKTYKMWYSYRGKAYRIGYAESNDGIHWERKDDEVGIDVSKSGWDSEMIEYAHVFDHKGQRYMLYNGNGYGKTGFGLAILKSD